MEGCTDKSRLVPTTGQPEIIGVAIHSLTPNPMYLSLDCDGALPQHIFTVQNIESIDVSPSKQLIVARVPLGVT